MRFCLFFSGLLGLKTQSALCLAQAAHGCCRSHFTFRSAQRIHEKVALFEVLIVVARPAVAILLIELRTIKCDSDCVVVGAQMSRSLRRPPKA
jgi:hypothetical protein